MASFCKVVVVGNVVRDVELKYLPSGTAVTDMSVVVNDRVKKGDSYEDVPSFIDVTLFGRSAEVASEFLAKGSQCLIEGRLKQDTWNDNEGKKRSKLKVVGERMVLLGKRGDSNGGGASEQQGAADEDLPF